MRWLTITSFPRAASPPGDRRSGEGMTGNTYQITPFMHVADLGEAVRFFTETLDFTMPVRQANYAYVEREGAAIRILEAGPEDRGTPHRGFGCYIDVRDLGQVVAALGPKLAALPAGDVHGPVDQPYGQRELMIRAPDGNLLVFGQGLDQE
jgi:catechol 2,3-dioxygenase-like lactoylglutathione lyase family enzyme